MKISDVDILNRDWLLKNVSLQVVSKDKYSHIIEDTCRKDIEGTDLAFVAGIETEDVKIKLMKNMALVARCTVQEIIDRAEENARNIEGWKKPNEKRGLCLVSPAANAFLADQVSTCFRNSSEGIYLLPIYSDAIVAVRADSMAEDEVKELLAESIVQLEAAGYEMRDNIISENVYHYKNGKYRMI